MNSEMQRYLRWRAVQHCKKCRLNKPFSAFGINKLTKSGYNSQCKDCRNYRVVSKRYNLKYDRLGEMFKEQNSCCAICKTHKSKFEKGLAVDHCHNTGKIRGLLCTNCNNGLGRFYDNIMLLEEAISYLKGK